MKIQYLLAVPFWLWAAWLFLGGVATWAHYINKPDIGPLIGWNGLFNGVTQGSVIAVIGTLTFFAFRGVEISVKGK